MGYTDEKKRVYDAEYRQSHKEETKSKRKIYYEAHKEELRARSREYNKTHKEEKATKMRIYNRQYYQLNKGKINAKNRAYNKTLIGRQSRIKALKNYQKNYPEKVLAHQKVNTALRSGKLNKKPCQVCEASGVISEAETHHPDYSKPLDVMWLCDKHHKEIHKEERRKNADNREANRKTA